MKHRTTIALGVIAVALVAFIVIYERNTLSTGEVEARQGKLIERFVRDRVTKLEIEHASGRVVLEREPTKQGLDGEPELAKYRLTSPVRAGADSDAVDGLLSALEWATARRSLRDVSAEDLHTFGLDEPRLRASFTVANARIPIAIGGEDVHGGGVYVQLDEPGVVYVAGVDFYEALDHDAAHFRDKELFGDIEVSLSSKLAREGLYEVQREGRSDRFVSPALGAASPTKVTELLDGLAELSASRYLEGAAGAPEATFRMEHDGHLIRLRVFGPCEGHEGERFVRVDEGPSLCVVSSALDPLLSATPESLREGRVVTTRDEDVRRFEIAAGGRTLLVSRGEDDTWTTLLRGSGAEVRGNADPAAVLATMRALRALRAESFESARAAESASATLRIFGEEETALETVELVGVDTDAVRAKRSSDEAVVRLPASSAELFVVSTLRFRARLVIDEDDEQAVRLEVSRPGLTETLTRDDEGTWNVTEPATVTADGPLMRELLRDASALETPRFVAESALPEHGLEHPRFVLTVHYERGEADEHDHDHEGEDEEEHPERAPRRDYVLELGGSTAEGAFGRLRAADGHGGPEVFLVRPSIANILEHPLASRDLLATSEEIRSIVVTAGTAEATASEEQRAAIAPALASLRASEVRAYAPIPFARVTRRVVITLAESAPEPRVLTLDVGEFASREPAFIAPEGNVFVRREGVPVLYVVPESAMRVLTDLTSSEATGGP